MKRRPDSSSPANERSPGGRDQPPVPIARIRTRTRRPHKARYDLSTRPRLPQLTREEIERIREEANAFDLAAAKVTPRGDVPRDFAPGRARRALARPLPPPPDPEDDPSNVQTNPVTLQWFNLIEDADCGDVDALRVVLIQARRNNDVHLEQRMVDLLIDVAVTDSDGMGRSAIRSLATYARLTKQQHVFRDAVALAFAGADEQDQGTSKRADWIALIDELQSSPIFFRDT